MATPSHYNHSDNLHSTDDKLLSPVNAPKEFKKQERQVYRMHKAGSIKNLQLQTEELDEPKADEVTVQVKAIGLNFADIFAMQGLYSATPPGSFIPGLEFSGEVISVGSSVEEWKVGDKV